MIELEFRFSKKSKEKARLIKEAEAAYGVNLPSDYVKALKEVVFGTLTEVHQVASSKSHEIRMKDFLCVSKPSLDDLKADDQFTAAMAQLPVGAETETSWISQRLIEQLPKLFTANGKVTKIPFARASAAFGGEQDWESGFLSFDVEQKMKIAFSSIDGKHILAIAPTFTEMMKHAEPIEDEEYGEDSDDYEDGDEA